MCLVLILLLGVLAYLFVCLVSPSSWSLIPSVDQTHKYLPISTSPVLSLKVYATVPGQGNVCFKSSANGQALKKDLITHQPPLCSHVFPLREPTIYNTVFRLDCFYLPLPLESKTLWRRSQVHSSSLDTVTGQEKITEQPSESIRCLFSGSSNTSVPTSIT